MIRALIFDFNGVLVDDEHLHFELLRDMLASRGVLIGEAEYFAEYMGWDDRRCLEEGLSRAGKHFTSDDIDSLIATKARNYLAAARRGLRYFDGAAESVKRLSARWPVAICSGALRPEIELALETMGVRDSVSAIVSSEDTDRCKPDPEGYLLALDALRSQHGEDLEAGHCLVIEDTMAGVQAAKGAGMWVIGITNTTDESSLRSAGADAVVQTLAALDASAIEQFFNPEISP